MSLAERLGFRSRPVAYVVVGATAIEVATASGSGRSARWLEGSYRRIELVAAVGLPAAIALVGPPVAPTCRGIRVVVADSWLAVGGVPWSAGLKRRAGAEASGRLHLLAEGFNIDGGDTVRVDDGSFAEPQLAVAYPQELLAALAALADRWGVPLLSVAPLSTAAWVAMRSAGARPGRVVALIADGIVLMGRALGSSGRRLSEVQVRAGMADAAVVPELQQLWRRSRLRDAQLGSMTSVATFDLTTNRVAGGMLPPPFVAEQPLAGRAEGAPSVLLQFAAGIGGHRFVDAMPARAEHGGWRWGMAIAGIAVALLLGLRADRAHDRRENLAARIAMQAAATPVARTRREPWSREEIARAQAVNVAVRELNLPIAALLEALQPPRDIRVAVLSVETSESPSGASVRLGGVRIVAEARGSADMARYAAYMADSKPFVSAYVVRHEIDDAAAERPYRFTLEASWSE